MTGPEIADLCATFPLPEGFAIRLCGRMIMIDAGARVASRDIARTRTALANHLAEGGIGRRMFKATHGGQAVWWTYVGRYPENKRAGIRVEETSEERDRHLRGCGGVFDGLPREDTVFGKRAA